MKYRKRIHTLCLLLALILCLRLLPAAATAETPEPETERTIMMYLCGSNLESDDGFATYTLKQIMSASFSGSGKVRFLVMTGGATNWYMESDYLIDPDTGMAPEGGISTEYNQVWEICGIDADIEAYRGKMVLVDGDGPTGTKVTDSTGLMSDAETLTSFIDFAAAYAPAKKYDLILWDHGEGPTGAFALDWHETIDEGSAVYMSFAELLCALSDNAVTRGGGKFDMINFDACLMNSVELDLAMADYTEYYIASPEFVPAYSEVYTGWLNALGERPDMDAFSLGKIAVDDYIAFYNKGYDDGGRQEGALAVVDLQALVNGDFVSALTDLNDLLEKQLKTDISFYDELRSVSCSIKYGGGSKGYYDLGNLAAYLGAAVKEGGGTQTANDYAGITARLLSILHDETVIYAKGTENITTKNEVWLDENGKDRAQALPTSGMYIFFPDAGMSTYVEMEYCTAMDDALAMLPDGMGRDFLSAWCDTTVDYFLLLTTGRTVTALVNEGKTKEEINYTAVKEYLCRNNEFEYNIWEMDDGVGTLVERVGGEAAVMDWMDRMARQQACEAVYRESVEVYKVDDPAGEGFQVRISDTGQRVIDSVSCNLYAELPIAEQYLTPPFSNVYFEDFKEIIDWGYLSPDFQIGTIDGSREVSSEDFENYDDWWNGSESTWELDPMDGKWYAIQDADGINHLATVDVRGNEIGVPAIIPMEEDDEEPHIVMVVFNTEGQLIELYSFVEGRGGLPSALKGELTVIPILLMMFYDTIPYCLPISEPLTITAADAGDIRLTYADVADISDIRDTDGDGDVLSRRIVVKDIYGASLDLSEQMAEPAGTLTSIKYAEIRNMTCTGEALLPQVVTAKGQTLTEGVDYLLYTGDPMIEPGTYTVGLEGLGAYTGFAYVDFVIEPKEGSAPAFAFEDVSEDAYYCDAVKWAVENGVTKGTDATHFSPDEKCTRAQMVTFLWRAAGSPEPTVTVNPFSDVREGAFYYKAVLWAVQNSITNGIDKTHFGPDQGCTRAQAVTFLWRTEHQPKPSNDANPFADVLGGYYYNAVLWAAEKGITKGTSADKFSPDATCTRGQVVTFLCRDMG